MGVSERVGEGVGVGGSVSVGVGGSVGVGVSVSVGVGVSVGVSVGGGWRHLPFPSGAA